MLLMILRHGKAEKTSPTWRDPDRPLASRGHEQAEFLAQSLKHAKSPLAAPTVIMSSRAVRARTTAATIGAKLGIEVAFDDALALDTSLRQAMALVHRLAKAGEPALLVGHNPQLENLVATLSKSDKHLHTGELVAFDLRDDPKGLEAKELARLRFDESD